MTKTSILETSNYLLIRINLIWQNFGICQLEWLREFRNQLKLLVKNKFHISCLYVLGTLFCLVSLKLQADFMWAKFSLNLETFYCYCTNSGSFQAQIYKHMFVSFFHSSFFFFFLIISTICFKCCIKSKNLIMLEEVQEWIFWWFN